MLKVYIMWLNIEVTKTYVDDKDFDVEEDRCYRQRPNNQKRVITSIKINDFIADDLKFRMGFSGAFFKTRLKTTRGLECKIIDNNSFECQIKPEEKDNVLKIIEEQDETASPFLKSSFIKLKDKFQFLNKDKLFAAIIDKSPDQIQIGDTYIGDIDGLTIIGFKDNPVPQVCGMEQSRPPYYAAKVTTKCRELKGNFPSSGSVTFVKKLPKTYVINNSYVDYLVATTDNRSFQLHGCLSSTLKCPVTIANNLNYQISYISNPFPVGNEVYFYVTKKRLSNEYERQFILKYTLKNGQVNTPEPVWLDYVYNFWINEAYSVEQFQNDYIQVYGSLNRVGWINWANKSFYCKLKMEGRKIATICYNSWQHTPIGGNEAQVVHVPDNGVGDAIALDKNNPEYCARRYNGGANIFERPYGDYYKCKGRISDLIPYQSNGTYHDYKDFVFALDDTRHSVYFLQNNRHAASEEVVFTTAITSLGIPLWAKSREEKPFYIPVLTR